MFNFFKKKQQETSDIGTRFHFNEIVLKTMKNEVIRCEDINAYFSSSNTVVVEKRVTHDDIRQAMIKVGYIFSCNNIVSSKIGFEEAIKLELNQKLNDNGVQCERVSIREIEKLY